MQFFIVELTFFKASAGNKNDIDYVTISTAGNAIDFGDSTQSTEDINTSCVSSKELVDYMLVDINIPHHHDQIGFITISSTGNSSSQILEI